MTQNDILESLGAQVGNNFRQSSHLNHLALSSSRYHRLLPWLYDLIPLQEENIPTSYWLVAKQQDLIPSSSDTTTDLPCLPSNIIKAIFICSIFFSHAVALKAFHSSLFHLKTLDWVIMNTHFFVQGRLTVDIRATIIHSTVSSAGAIGQEIISMCQLAFCSNGSSPQLSPHLEFKF